MVLTEKNIREKLNRREENNQKERRKKEGRKERIKERDNLGKIRQNTNVNYFFFIFLSNFFLEGNPN